MSTYLYKRGACGFAGGYKFNWGNFVGGGLGPVYCGFCDCGWQTAWSSVIPYDQIYAHGKPYGAIAYSPSTRRVFPAYGCASADEAQKRATAGSSDAVFIGWAYDGFLAFALADSGCGGFALDADRSRAEFGAITECRAHEQSYVSQKGYSYNPASSKIITVFHSATGFW